MSSRLDFGTCTLTIDHEERRCVFETPGGVPVPAIPEATEDYESKSRRMGFVDSWELCWVHEALHALLYALSGGRGVFAVLAGLEAGDAERQAFEEAFLLLAGECLTGARRAAEG